VEGFGGLVFFIIQNPPDLGELKNCVGGVWRVLGGLRKFFKFNLCCYNTFKVKNTLIISINLSFSTKPLSQKIRQIYLVFPLISSLQNSPLPSPPNSQTEPKNFPLYTNKETILLFNHNELFII